MRQILRQKVIDRFENPVNNPRDCDKLTEVILTRTGRKISSTTLRRFFGMLASESELSKYSLNTLAIFCGSEGYKQFEQEYEILNFKAEKGFIEILAEVKQITTYTLNSVRKKSLTPFQLTIERQGINESLEAFIQSDFTVFPMIASGGYGKSIALAHWVKSIRKTSRDQDLILFCQASMLIRLLVQSKQNSKNINIALSDTENLFNRFSQYRQKENQKLILIIDGLDEPDNDIKGILQLTNFIISSAVNFHSLGFLKIVLAVREISWNKTLYPEFSAVNPSWLLYNPGYSLESGSSNLQELSCSEVKQILGLHNVKSRIPIIYDCIDWRLRELIRIPINLYLFSTLSSNPATAARLTPEKLILEYMNKVIFKTRFAEEKADIIWKLIKFSLQYPTEANVKKSQLKDIYPIHLRKESNYHSAYQELLSLGILNEIQTENKYGLLVTRIQFRHSNFYYYLTAMYLADMYQDIDIALFKRVTAQNRSIEWISNVCSFVFQIAYQQEEFEALKDFCELDESILSSLQIRHTVGNAFRHPNKIRIPLIKHYAAHPMGQVHFFERFVDTNYIFDNYEFRISEYLEHKKTMEAQLFGHCILFISDFLKMNSYGCEKQIQIIEGIEASKEIYPWPIGRKVSSNIFFHYFILGKAIDNLESYIHKYRKIAYSYENYLNNGKVEFEMYIMVSLTMIEEWDILSGLIKTARENYNLTKPNHDGFTWIPQHQNSLMDIFFEYAQFKCTGIVTSSTIQHCAESLDNYISFFDDYIYLILIHFFLYEYYKHTGKDELAGNQFHSAMALARHAKYSFFEAYLMYKGSGFHPDYLNLAAKLFSKASYHPKVPWYQSAPDKK